MWVNLVIHAHEKCMSSPMSFENERPVQDEKID